MPHMTKVSSWLVAEEYRKRSGWAYSHCLERRVARKTLEENGFGVSTSSADLGRMEFGTVYDVRVHTQFVRYLQQTTCYSTVYVLH